MSRSMRLRLPAALPPSGGRAALHPKIMDKPHADQEELTQHIASICRACASPAANRSGRPTIAIASSFAEAFELARAKSNPILITGSLHFAGEALANLTGKPAAFEECNQ